MSVRLSARACPECGEVMDGLEGDAVLSCGSCGLGRVAADGRRLPLRFARSRHDAPGVVLPVYEFPLSMVPPEAAGPELGERMGRLTRGLVAGFRVRRFQDYGDLAVEYTRRQVRFEPGEARPLAGCTRLPEEAARLLLHALDRLAAEEEPTSEEWRVTLGEPTLWGVPARVSAGVIHLPQTAIRYPANLLESAAALAAGLPPERGGRRK